MEHGLQLRFWHRFAVCCGPGVDVKGESPSSIPNLHTKEALCHKRQSRGGGHGGFGNGVVVFDLFLGGWSRCRRSDIQETHLNHRAESRERKDAALYFAVE
ncbi:hypothetical protein EYF80_016641 [Liparis tanakae]|uniref:Uncharacterized protein n=1 Tax=Liparis tanakae TaxID=230148 RepID=A0A4Z2I6S6_9TELE|nr:hypothetical protein EYF80_016641 [Liparis tanakae]